MPYRFYIILAILLGTFWYQNATAAESSCDCPQMKCNDCQDEARLEFYTEKCDSGRVRSCKRPICKAKDPLPAACKSVSGNETVSASKNEEAQPKVKTPEVKTQENANRPNITVGVIAVALGECWVVTKGEKRKAIVGKNVQLEDVLETGGDGKFKIVFRDKNILSLTPNSQVALSDYNYEAEGMDNRTLLNLMYGKIRNTISQKYQDDQGNYYKVKTPTAVAGVRGTDFVASYNTDSNGDKTEITTLKGQVNFASENGDQQANVMAGQKVAYVIAANTKEDRVFNETDIQRFVAKGYMTPVYELTANELESLRAETQFSQGRSIASAEEVSICANPKGNLNQCAWKCDNNPPGARTCRTDLKGVSCVRKRCNANGSWAEETRLPASFFDACSPHEVKVAPCNY